MDFTPSVYEHAAALIGRSPWDVSRDGELLFKGHVEAYRRYGHSPVMVGIDIYNLEAEAYGATVARPEGNAVPAISGHPCTSAREIRQLPPFDPALSGRIPMMLEAASRLTKTFPAASVCVPVSGPFSIACALMDFEPLLYGVTADPAGVRDALMHLAATQIGFCRAIHEHGLGIALFESAAAPPLLAPKMFEFLELPALRHLMAGASAATGRPVPCIIGGDTAPILDQILSTGTGYVICPAETDQAAFMRRVWNRTDVRVRINMDLRVLVQGPWQAIRSEVDRMLALARGRPNVCMGTGVLPYETPPERVLQVAEYVRGQG